MRKIDGNPRQIVFCDLAVGKRSFQPQCRACLVSLEQRAAIGCNRLSSLNPPQPPHSAAPSQFSAQINPPFDRPYGLRGKTGWFPHLYENVQCSVEKDGEEGAFCKPPSLEGFCGFGIADHPFLAVIAFTCTLKNRVVRPVFDWGTGPRKILCCREPRGF